MVKKIIMLIIGIILLSSVVSAVQILCMPLESDTTDYALSQTIDTIGTPSYAAGKVGNAIHLSGTGQFLNLSTDEQLANFTPASLTACLWVNSDTLPENAGLIGAGFWDDGEAWFLDYPSTDNLRFTTRRTASLSSDNADNSATETWYHVCGQYNQTSQRIVVNGVQKGVSDAFDGTNQFKHVYIGAYYDPSLAFDGWIDEVKVWDAYLSMTQIQDDYNAGSGVACSFVPPIVNNFTITATNTYYGETLNTFNATVNGTLFTTTTGTINTEILVNSTYLYNISIIAPKHDSRTYLNYNISTDIATTLNFSYYRLNATIYYYDGTAINGGFTINATSSIDHQSVTVTTINSVLLNLSKDYNYTIIINAINYSYGNTTIYMDDWLENETFNLFLMQSIDIYFYDLTTGLRANGINISAELIGLTPLIEYTNISNINVTLLTPDTYTILYTAAGFRQGKYIFTVATKSYQTLNLYLQNTTDTNLILLTTKDRFGNILKNVEIIIQRWFNSAWITEQIVESDFNGQAEAYYTLSTIYYNHVLKYNNIIYFGIMNDDSEKKVIYTEDVTNGITFYIDISGDNTFSEFQEAQDVTTNLTYINTSNTTGYFRYFWSDSGNNQKIGKLEVYKDGNLTNVCSNSTTTATGLITCSVSQPSGKSIYTAKGSIDDYITDDDFRIIGAVADTSINWGLTGYFIGFIFVATAFFAFLSVPTVSIWVGTIVFILLSIFGLMFKDVGYTYLIILLALGYLVAAIKSNSGVNA